MLNWLLRYQPALALLEEFEATEVLDVGAGWHGLSRWWDGRVVQTDLLLAERPRKNKHQGTPIYVRSSADLLPFADDSFDFTVSLDMMEHLPLSIRSASIRELTRVARRGVIVGYPVGEVAAELDLAIAASQSRRGLSLPSWLAEHLSQREYPDREALECALPSDWRITREIPNGNVRVQRALVEAELIPGFSTLSGVLEKFMRSTRHLARWIHAAPTYRTIWLLEPRPVPVA
ncbi:hypothetical protein GCM10009740_03010 [Terrabacter terrae]|uniref:Methyltransferase type 11 domain-containing protein n=1 Tax=Terrabacter terrae TaxID=318434 RepID=A0ABN2TRG8_9MICO